MTIKHHWKSKNLLHTCYSGRVTGEDMLQAAHEVGNDPRLANIRFIIGDWSKIESSEISADHVRELAAYIVAVSKSFPRVKNASVVANYESGVARANLYDLLIEESPWQTAAFATVDEAMAWFGLSED